MNSAGVGGYFMAGIPAVLKSLQTGTIDLNNVASATATITAVVVANTRLSRRGATHALNAAVSVDVQWYMVVLTNTTTITASRKAAEATAFPVGYTAEEYVSGVLKSCATGTIDVNGGTSATATITSVNTGKAFVDWLGTIHNLAGDAGPFRGNVLLTLTNATTVTASVNANPTVSNITSFQVPEYAV